MALSNSDNGRVALNLYRIRASIAFDYLPARIEEHLKSNKVWMMSVTKNVRIKGHNS